MPKRKKASEKKPVPARFVVGRERFTQISAVEGIKPTRAMKKRAATFDKLGLTAAERRRQIIKAHSKG